MSQRRPAEESHVFLLSFVSRWHRHGFQMTDGQVVEAALVYDAMQGHWSIPGGLARRNDALAPWLRPLLSADALVEAPSLTPAYRARELEYRQSLNQQLFAERGTVVHASSSICVKHFHAHSAGEFGGLPLAPELGLRWVAVASRPGPSRLPISVPINPTHRDWFEQCVALTYADRTMSDAQRYKR